MNYSLFYNLKLIGDILLIIFDEEIIPNRKEKMDEAASELQAFRDGSADSPKHIDYSTLGSYCWYRHGTDSYGVPTIEMYGIHPGENQADATTPPPKNFTKLLYKAAEVSYLL